MSHSCSSRPHDEAKFQGTNRKKNIFLRNETKTDMGDNRVDCACFPFSLYIQLFSFTSTETIQVIKVFSGSTKYRISTQVNSSGDKI
jgi:hypothetical protein